MTLKYSWLAALVPIGIVSTLLFRSLLRARRRRCPSGPPGSFAVLAGSAVTNTGPTILNGDLGVWSGTSITGFPPGIVNGNTHDDDAVAMGAQSDSTTAYNFAAGREPDGEPERFRRSGADPEARRVQRVIVTGCSTERCTLDAQGDPSRGFHLPDRLHAHHRLSQPCGPDRWRPSLQRVLAGGQFSHARDRLPLPGHDPRPGIDHGDHERYRHGPGAGPDRGGDARQRHDHRAQLRGPAHDRPAHGPHGDTDWPHPDRPDTDSDCDWAHPNSDRPHTDTNRAHPNSDRPHTDTNRAHPDTDRPHTDTNRAHPDTDQPDTHTDWAHPDTDQPHTHTDQPHTYTDQPHTVTQPTAIARANTHPRIHHCSGDRLRIT